MYDAVLCFFLSFFATSIVNTCLPLLFETAQSYSSESLENTERKKKRADSVDIQDSVRNIITRRSSSHNLSAVTPLSFAGDMATTHPGSDGNSNEHENVSSGRLQTSPSAASRQSKIEAPLGKPKNLPSLDQIDNDNSKNEEDQEEEEDLVVEPFAPVISIRGPPVRLQTSSSAATPQSKLGNPENLSSVDQVQEEEEAEEELVQDFAPGVSEQPRFVVVEEFAPIVSEEPGAMARQQRHRRRHKHRRKNRHKRRKRAASRKRAARSRERQVVKTDSRVGPRLNRVVEQVSDSEKNNDAIEQKDEESVVVTG